MTCSGIFPMLKYHKQITFIVLFELFQRVSYYGFQIMLFLFLKHEMQYSLGKAIGVYHLFVGLGYIATIIGSTISYTCLPKFVAILLMTFIGINGNVLIVLASAATAPDGLREIGKVIPYFLYPGLVLRAVGTGGIRELVRAFGSDQFVQPDEKKELNDYFQLLYYCMTVGTLLAYIMVPQIRMQVSCFGLKYCFPVAFVVPATLIVLALTSFLCGAKMYKHKKPAGSVTLQCIKCVFSAMGNCRGPDRFLENSEGFTNGFIADFRATIPVLPLFLPLPIFWSLIEQMGSRWTYQASRMDGSLGSSSGIYIEPDQMQILNPIIILTGIPLMELVFYPLMNLCLISTALRRNVIGAILAALSFVASAMIETKIERNMITFNEDLLEHQFKGVHMVWLLPQYLLLSIAQFLYPLALLEFTYTQVPPSMRSVLLTCWLLTIAIGNFIAMVVGFANVFDRELWNHVLFAGVMGADVLLVLVVSCRYKTLVEDDQEA